MFWKKSEYKSTSISIIIHLLILLLLMAFKITPEVDMNEYVTIGFGDFGNSSSSGAISKRESKKKTKKDKEKKEVEVPTAKNVDETNKTVAAKESKKEDAKPEEKKVEKDEGLEDNSEGKGNFGFELEFGGKGKRKIYSYNIPAYPPGVSKEIDVKLRFTIMADGSVGRIIPIQKADTRLEAAAMNSLRQWRFEPLPEGTQSKPQSVAITFPFRLQ
ncbi:MAG: TonB family protein [Melioribacteraceae bacterium]|jgi:TonB family protein|nr:TonB family protein [Melioribacteraceae bacterium]